MEKAKRQKLILILGLIILFVLIAAYSFYYRPLKISRDLVPASSPASSLPEGLTVEDLKKLKVPEPQEKVEDINIAVPKEAAQSAPQTKSKTKFFEIKGENKGISPNNFIVYKNDILNIKLTALDGDYDFFLEDYNLNLKANKGETKTIEFQTVNIGKFNIYCFLCSSKEEPAGTLIVRPL